MSKGGFILALEEKAFDNKCLGVVEVITMKKKRFCPKCGGEIEGRSTYCCYVCSMEAVIEANKQLRDKKGPIYEKWKSRLKASIERL